MVDILKLQLRYKLTLDETQTKVILLPLDEYGFTTFPLPEDLSGCIAVSVDEYTGFLTGVNKFDPTLTKVIPIPDEEILGDEN